MGERVHHAGGFCPDGARFAWQASPRWRGPDHRDGHSRGRLTLSLLFPPPAEAVVHVWPLALAVIAGALLGATVFVAMGGSALILFFRDLTPVSAVPAEVYRLMYSPTLPAIPLLTACGYVLAESQASARLVRFFRALFGWMPGGIAVMVGGGLCTLHHVYGRVGRDHHRSGWVGLQLCGRWILRRFLAGTCRRIRQPSGASIPAPASRSSSTASWPAAVI